jgi:hypothetical protein
MFIFFLILAIVKSFLGESNAHAIATAIIPPPWRLVKSFAILPSPPLALLELRSEPLKLGMWGRLPPPSVVSFFSDTDTSDVFLDQFLVVDDSGVQRAHTGDHLHAAYQMKRVSLYERIPLELGLGSSRFLGYIQSEVQAYPTHEQPYLVYHLQDAICGEDLPQTLHDGWLLSYAISSHELEKSERQTYNLILSYNTKRSNLHWKSILTKHGFKTWGTLDQKVQNLTLEIYHEAQFFHMGHAGEEDAPGGDDWVTMFYFRDVTMGSESLTSIME